MKRERKKMIIDKKGLKNKEMGRIIDEVEESRGEFWTGKLVVGIGNKIVRVEIEGKDGYMEYIFRQ